MSVRSTLGHSNLTDVVVFMHRRDLLRQIFIRLTGCQVILTSPNQNLLHGNISLFRWILPKKGVIY